jgi:hypothetical protein
MASALGAIADENTSSFASNPIRESRGSFANNDKMDSNSVGSSKDGINRKAQLTTKAESGWCVRMPTFKICKIISGF